LDYRNSPVITKYSVGNFCPRKSKKRVNGGITTWKRRIHYTADIAGKRGITRACVGNSGIFEPEPL
jgi:hypothetical protein